MKTTKKITLKDYYENCGVYINITELERIFACLPMETMIQEKHHLERKIPIQSIHIKIQQKTEKHMSNKKNINSMGDTGSRSLCNQFPVSKILLQKIPPTMMAALLYPGAGTGMLILGTVQRKMGWKNRELSLTKKELPYTVGMVFLDIAAPVFLMVGLSMASVAKTSTYYAVAPFIGVALSFLIFREIPSVSFIVAFFIMIAGTYLASKDQSTQDG